MLNRTLQFVLAQLVVALLASVSAAAEAPRGMSPLIVYTDKHAGADTSLDNFLKHARRSALGRVDESAFVGADLMQTQRLSVNLFGVPVEAVVMFAKARNPDEQAWFGSIADDPYGHVVVTKTHGRFAISVLYLGAQYLIVPAQAGKYGIVEVDRDWLLADIDGKAIDSADRRKMDAPSFLLTELGRTKLTPLKPIQDGSELVHQPKIPREYLPIVDDGSQIDLLIVYSALAGAQLGTAPQAVINLHVAVANLSFVVSGVPTWLNVVAPPAKVELALDNIAQDLVAVTAAGEGYLDDIHLQRDQLAADLVVLYTDNGQPDGVCGITHLHDSRKSVEENAVFGFAVVSAACPDKVIVLAHEVGHLLGSVHDHFSSILEGIEDSAGNVLGVASHARGYVVPPSAAASNRGFVSIMASPYTCEAQGWDCERQHVWSNAHELIFGQPFGIEAGYVGSADNVGRLNGGTAARAQILIDVATFRRSICRSNPNCL